MSIRSKICILQIFTNVSDNGEFIIYKMATNKENCARFHRKQTTINYEHIMWKYSLIRTFFFRGLLKITCIYEKRNSELSGENILVINGA